MFARMLVERIEHRIIVGTAAIIGIMIVLSWLAINEGGRMQAADDQFLARSVERGAMLFASQCSTCHNQDGTGRANWAPALNNPQLFGHSFTAQIDSEANQLNVERSSEGVTEERIAEIDARLAELEIERNNVIAQMQVAIDAGYDPNNPSRVEQVEWSGGLRTFIYNTLVSGRPSSQFYYPVGDAMPPWLEPAGPLRADQLEDLTNFIMNWDKGNNWTLEDLNAVQQFAVVPGPGGASEEVAGDVVGLDASAAYAAIEGLTGDPNNGQVLYNGTLACATCHTGGTIGPDTAGTWTRTVNERLNLPEYEGFTGEEYLVHSIIAPNEYVVQPYAASMPGNFGERLDAQSLADLVAYLRSQDQ